MNEWRLNGSTTGFFDLLDFLRTQQPIIIASIIIAATPPAAIPTIGPVPSVGASFEPLFEPAGSVVVD